MDLQLKFGLRNRQKCKGVLARLSRLLNGCMSSFAMYVVVREVVLVEQLVSWLSAFLCWLVTTLEPDLP